MHAMVYMWISLLTCIGISTLTSGFSFSMNVVMEFSMKFSVDVVILSSAALSVDRYGPSKYFKGSLSHCQSF